MPARYSRCIIVAALTAFASSSCEEEYDRDPWATTEGPERGGSSFGGATIAAGTSAQGGTSVTGEPHSSAGAGAIAGSLSLAGTPSNAGAAGVAGAAGAIVVARQPTFHIFLLLGQSNMSGYPPAEPADRIEDERIKVLGFDNCPNTGRVKDQWDIAAPPLHLCDLNALGPGDYFAKRFLERLPQGDTIGLVPCATTGDSIDAFMKTGGTKYDGIIQRARIAQQAGGVISGILFHQGESDNGQSTWPSRVLTFVTDLRNDLGIGTAPFLAGEMAYSGNCATHNTYVNQLPGLISNAHVVSAQGLAVDPADNQWNVHFDHASQVTLGIRYAEKMLSVLGW